MSAPAPGDDSTNDDAALARRVAQTAGDLLLTLQRSDLFEGKALGRAGDRVANAFIMEALAVARPEDAILSEEEAEDSARLTKSRVWIVDPLDGTREFGERRTDWAVHIALAIDGIATVGAVALPGFPMVLATEPPPTVLVADGPLKMLVSRTRPAPQAVAVAAKLGAELVPMGSAGAKAMAVVRGEAHIYLHAGGQYEWDSCAPVAVALAHGLHCSRIDGAPLIYNQADVYMPDLLICRREDAGRLIELVKAIVQ